MAAPAVQTTAESATTTASTSHTVTLPSGIAAGDLLVIIGCGVAATTYDASGAGFTELLDENAVRGIRVFVKLATGSEGASITITSAASQKPAWIAYRISGADDPAVTAPTLGTTATGTSTTPDPPNCNPGVTNDYLAIALYTLNGEEADDDTWTTAAPAGYSNLLQKTAGTAGTNTSAVLATAERQLTGVSSENPGTFTTVTSVNNSWRAQTLMIPAAPSGQSFSLPVATETDTSQTPTFSKAFSLPVATGTMTAQELAFQKLLSLPVASETDSAQALAFQKSFTLPVATEADAAQALAFIKSFALPVASETDTAVTLTFAAGGQTFTLPVATEAEAAQALSFVKSFSLPVTTETDTAQTPSFVTSFALPVAAETDTAVVLSFTKRFTLPVAGNFARVYTMTTSGGGLNSYFHHFTAVPGTTYTYSFYAKRGTATDNKLSVYDWTNGADVIGVTSYYAEINGSTFTRVTRTFVAPPGATDIAVYLTRDSGADGTTFVAAAQLEVGSSATPWSKGGQNLLSSSEDLAGVGWGTFSGAALAAEGSTLELPAEMALPFVFVKSFDLDVALETDTAQTLTGDDHFSGIVAAVFRKRIHRPMYAGVYRHLTRRGHGSF